MIQYSAPNHAPTMTCICSPCRRRKSAFCGRSGRPWTVEYATIDMNTMVRNDSAANVTACSTFAMRHQRRQRPMFSAVGSNVKPVEGAAHSSPVMGLTSRGT